MKLSELLAELRVRPGMYVGYPSVTRMCMLLAGFRIAFSGNGPHPELDVNLDDFRRWLATKHNVPQNITLESVILWVTSYERNGFDMFWAEYDLWQAAKKLPIETFLPVDFAFPQEFQCSLTPDPICGL